MCARALIRADCDRSLVPRCDGLWDVIGPDDAWELARRKGRKERGVWDLEKVARELVKAAYDLNSGDNISVLVLNLRPPRHLKGAGVAVKADVKMQHGHGAAAGSSGSGGRPSHHVKASDVSVTVGSDGHVQAVRLKE